MLFDINLPDRCRWDILHEMSPAQPGHSDARSMLD
jgi:hypothetical protein